jgi:hypothetical protein
MKLRFTALALAAAWHAVFIARTSFTWDGRTGFTLFDDGMISMRYARHLADGFGLVWNPGGPPVEGYTNPLWTLFMAAVHALGFSDLLAPLVVMVAGSALLLLTAVLAARVAAAISDAPAAPLVALVLTLADYALGFWTLRGMEVGLLAAATAGMVLATLRYIARPATRPLMALCALAVLAMLTRRDAVIPVAVCALYLAAFTAGRARWRAAAAAGAAIVFTQAALLGFSAWYFGDAWPNTYYLKLEGVTLVERLARGVPAAILVILRHLGPLLLVALPALWPAPWRSRASLPVAIVVVQLAYSAYVGGDAWEFMGYANRYVALALPLACAAAAAGIVRVAPRPRQVVLACAALALAATVRAGGEVFLQQAGRGVERFGADGVIIAMPYVAAALALAIAAAVAMRRPARAGVAMAILVAQVWIAADAVAAGKWIARNASGVQDETRLALAGLTVRELTAPATVIAVSAAGNLPYFARRETIDILGKSDPVIARMPPAQAFHPGHNKWNLQHSIFGPRPDVIWGLPRRAGQVRQLVDAGYEPWRGSVFALPTSPHFDRATLQAAIAALYPDIPPRSIDE